MAEYNGNAVGFGYEFSPRGANDVSTTVGFSYWFYPATKHVPQILDNIVHHVSPGKIALAEAQSGNRVRAIPALIRSEP